MRKRSISIKGHRTSIRLEEAFWRELDAAAAHHGVSLPSLVEEIDRSRMKSTPPPGLASALRVFALSFAKKSGAGDKSR